MMVGDKRKYNIVLVTCKCVVDKDGNPTDKLDGDACDVDPACKTVGEAQKSAKWADYIKKGIKIYNDSATSNAHKVQYHTILDKDFSVNDGQLTATLKVSFIDVNYQHEYLLTVNELRHQLKRAVCNDMYKKEIDSLYKD